MALPWKSIAVVAVIAFFSSLPGVVVEPPIVPDGLAPKQEPSLSPLADREWWLQHGKDLSVSEDDIKFFEEHGFAILRNALPQQAVDMLYRDAQRLCHPQFQDSYVCRVKQARFRSDLFRDFLFHSPIGEIAKALLRRSGSQPLRVFEDGVFASSWRRWLLTFFSFYHHIDGNGAGVYHTFPFGTPGVSVWIPLQDLNPNATGGSVNVFGGGIYPKPCSLAVSGCFVIGRPENMTTPAVHRGDVLLWHPLLLHSAQPVLTEGFTRYVYFSWLVDADARSCRSIGCTTQGGMPCCKNDPVVAGSQMHHACYPQVGPAIQEEMDAYVASSLLEVDGDRGDGPGDIHGCLTSTV